MTFANSTWLLLLAILPFAGVIAGIVWIRRGKRWHQMIAQRLRNRLSQPRAGTWHFASLTLALLGLGALIITLAQPEGGEEFQEHKSEGRNILFCLDISRSMLTEDVAPNRLLAAKAAAQEIMDEFPNDRAGLLVFSGESDVQVPLTIDRAYVRRVIQEANPVDIPTGGSDLARAIREGTETLVKTGQRSNVMILLSDGEEHTEGLSNAAREAREEGIFVYALGFGTKAGGNIPDRSRSDGLFRDIRNKVVHSALNDTSMRLVAQETDGVYSQGVGPAFLKKLGETITEMEAFEMEGKHLRVAKPLFQWFLLPGILLVMLSIILRLIPSLRNGASVAVFLLAMMGTTRGNNLAEGRAALKNEDFTAASRHFAAAARESSGNRSARLQLAAGSAAYRAQDWETAASSFAEALRSDHLKVQEQAHFALSNSLFYQGAAEEGEKRSTLWKNAIEHLKEAQSLNPESTQIRENLEAIEQQLKQLQEQQKQQQQKQDQKKDQNKKSDDQKNDDDQKKQDQQGQDDQQKKDGENEEKKDNEKKDGKGEDENKKDGENPKGEEKKEQKNKESESGESDEPKDQKDQEVEQQKNDDQKQGQDQKEQAQQQQGDKKSGKESPIERARRILREHADMGRRPPRGRRYIPRRPLKDW